MTAADRKLLESFRKALAAQKLNLVYQPKVSLKDGRLTRVEALVRWDDPELGPVPPSRFVPLAEKHGLIDPLTEWGLRETLKQWGIWREQGLETRLAFNISAVNLQRLDFPDLVEGMCREMEVPADRLVLMGVSQGACLAQEYAARHARRYHAVVGLSGGLIGPPGTPRDYAGSFDDTPVFLGCSDMDPHIPVERVHESADVFARMGAAVDKRIYPRMGHTVNVDEIQAVAVLLA